MKKNYMNAIWFVVFHKSETLYLIYNRVAVNNILVVIVCSSDMTMNVLKMPIGLQLDLFCFQPYNDAVSLFIMN